jgi:hypothetical protein
MSVLHYLINDETDACILRICKTPREQTHQDWMGQWRNPLADPVPQMRSVTRCPSP